MSSFAVFGMTDSYAHEWARKHIRTTEGARSLTQEEWLQRVEEAAEKLLMKGKRRVRLSPLFDAPQFAEQFMEIARRGRCRDLGIRVYAIERDESGSPVLSAKKKIKRSWSDWNGDDARAEKSAL